LVLPDDLKDLSGKYDYIMILARLQQKKRQQEEPKELSKMFRRGRFSINSSEKSAISASIPVKKASARRTRRTIQNVQQKEDSASTPVKRALETFAQESLKGFSSSDDNNNNFDASGLSSPAQEQWKKSEPYDLSDDEPTIVQDYNITKSLPNSFTLLINNKNNHVQATIPNILQKIASRKTNEEIQHKAEDIEINLNLQQKRSTQFQNMSNDFEIAHWVARHKKVLNLVINIRNGMMSNADEHDETTLTSSSRQQISIENVLSPPEIEQHIKSQLQDECKALFLRTRNNTIALYEELVIRVCKIAKTDYRLNSLTKDATDQQKLRRDSIIITKLGIFVRTAVKTILVSMETNEDTQKAIKKCDKDTIDLKIPTKFRVVSSLPVRELLDY
ncbi:2871_t:CDS:2, partial [Funneliformis caledonium]